MTALSADSNTFKRPGSAALGSIRNVKLEKLERLKYQVKSCVELAKRFWLKATFSAARAVIKSRENEKSLKRTPL